MMNEKQLHAGNLIGARGLSLGRPCDARPWLLLLCALLLVWQPLNLSLTMAGLVDELSLRGPGLAIDSPRAAARGGPGHRRGARAVSAEARRRDHRQASLAFSAIVDVIVYATPYSPNNRPPGDATIILVASLALLRRLVRVPRAIEARESYALTRTFG